MDNNTSLIEFTSYEDMRKSIKLVLLDMCHTYVSAGYVFKQAKESMLWQQAGYASFFDFIEAEFKVDKSRASRWMQINDQYSVGGNSMEILPQYKDYAETKLIEMLSLPQEVRDEIPPEASRESIREAKEVVKQMEEEATVGITMDFMPKPETSRPWEDETLGHTQRVILELFWQEKKSFKKFHELCQKEITQTVADRLLSTIAPSGFRMIHLSTDNIIINSSGLKMVGAGEKISIEQMAAVFTHMFRRDAEESYEMVYGEKLEEVKEPEKKEEPTKIRPTGIPKPEPKAKPEPKEEPKEEPEEEQFAPAQQFEKTEENHEIANENSEIANEKSEYVIKIEQSITSTIGKINEIWNSEKDNAVRCKQLAVQIDILKCHVARLEGEK